jgi:UDP-N-acetyl-D-galactosamine dehydrogenase
VADPDEALAEYGVRLLSWDALPAADAMVVAVAHQAFVSRPPSDFLDPRLSGGMIVDVKGAMPAAVAQAAEVTYWRL